MYILLLLLLSLSLSLMLLDTTRETHLKKRRSFCRILSFIFTANTHQSDEGLSEAGDMSSKKEGKLKIK